MSSTALFTMTPASSLKRSHESLSALEPITPNDGANDFIRPVESSSPLKHSTKIASELTSGSQSSALVSSMMKSNHPQNPASSLSPQTTARESPLKKRKTGAEKQADKQRKDEERQTKDAEKARKEEERRIKQEQAEEARKAKLVESEEKKRAKDEEKTKREESKAKKEAEKKAKEEEKAKKEKVRSTLIPCISDNSTDNHSHNDE